MTQPPITRRLAAILAAGVVDYSRMMEADEAGTVAALRQIWRETFDPAVAARRGRIVKTMGDGALVDFGSVIDAVECAVAVQRAMAERNLAAAGPVVFRIGINLGDIVVDGDDILGEGVNIAARLESQAPPGGILASDVVHAQVTGKVGVTFVDAGEVRLKNIDRSLRVWRWEGDDASLTAAPAGRARLPVAADKPSIAVLPFTVMSNDAEQAFFADGLVDDIRSRAARHVVRCEEYNPSGPEQMTVVEVNTLLYLPGHLRQQLLRALRVPALSPGWQASFRALLEGEAGSGNAGLTAKSPPPAWPGFRPLIVAGIERESDSVVSIRLEGPDGTPLPAAPGQYLTLRIQLDDEHRSILRNYSLSGPPRTGYYRISVKREPGGTASSYLHTRLKVGDEVDIAAPRGTFILDPTRAPVLLISAGIGATPLLAMLHALADERSEREVCWLHGARSNREHSFAAEARALLASLPNAHTYIYYSRPTPDDIEGRDFDSAGRLSAALLADLEPPRGAEAYLCGPAPFMEEISTGLVAIGLDASRIHTEPFGPMPGLTPGIASMPVRTPHLPAGRLGSGPTIEFARSNLAVRWNGDYANLLELAEACDVPVRWSCRTGVCHTCETSLISGQVDYSPDPVEPPADGSALICCAQPRASLVLDLCAESSRGELTVRTPTFSVEVITLPVSDVDRALRFYVDQVGFTLDVDYSPNGAFRVVQLTPPGSSCSIQIGNGFTDAPVGSLRNVYLVVTDLEAARSRLLERGVEVGETRHKMPIGAWDGGFAPGLDPARGDYASFADFSDPDGNSWVLQERGYRNV